MRRADLFGLGFMAPAILLSVLFFLVPVLLTGVFSFTSMSTSTGISGGAYEISQDTILRLKEDGLPGDVIERLETDSYQIDETGLTAVEKAYGARFAQDIANRFPGQSFLGGRTWNGS